jgi:hypothetical protein
MRHGGVSRECLIQIRDATALLPKRWQRYAIFRKLHKLFFALTMKKVQRSDFQLILFAFRLPSAP